MTSSLSRFNRAFDSIKKVVSKTPEEINRQKLKFTSYAALTELVCKSNDKSSLLTIAVTSLIQLLENADSNNRLIIDESLNKIIRSSIDNSNDIAKVLIALLKILSKSTNERCLKAALWRFAELAHFVRPHKGKIYVQTLIPVFVKLTGRKEDGIHEISVSSFPRIFRYIGLFTNDNDIKVLLKAFLKNLSSDSVEIRRAAAFNITVICQYSRKPHYFFSHSLSVLLDLLIDAQSIDRGNSLLIQGCLSCIRQILSCIAKPCFELENELCDKNLEYSLQIYELCLTYASYRDHNVVTAALETLHQLLLSATLPLVEKLTTSGNFTRSSLFKHEEHGSTLSLAAQSEIFSVGSTIAQTEDDLFGGELSKRINALRRGSESLPDVGEEQKQKMTEDWVQEQVENDEDDVSSSSLLNMDTSHFANSDDEDNRCEVDSTLSFRAMSVDNIQMAKEINEKNSLNRSKSAFQSMKSVSMMSSASLAMSFNTLSMDIDIGDIFDEKEIPLQYCARFLVTRFLLSDKGEPMRRTRVSVMSLALNCLAQLMKILPMSCFISVVKDKEIYDDFTSLLEVVLSHASHEDQQIRGFVRLVIGNIISASLVEDNYLLGDENYHLLDKTLLTELVGFLLQGLEDESSVCVRHCLQGVSVCLEPLLLTPEYSLVVPLLDFMFALMDNPYWLIKTKILEIFENISFDLLYFIADNSSHYQEKVFHKVILSCLEDADGRVRRAATRCLSKFVLHAYYPMDHNYELVATTFAKRFRSKIEISSFAGKKDLSKPKSNIKTSAALGRSLARVVHKLNQHFTSKSSSKSVIIGYCEALSFLASEYPPIEFAENWQCSYFPQLTNNYSPCELFDAALLLMTNSPLILNFDVHIHLLTLSSQLFIALCHSNFKVTENLATSVDKLWSYLSDEKLKDSAELFLRHLMRLSTIFSDVVTDVTVKSSVKLNSSQPLLRPVPVDQPLLMLHQSPLIDATKPTESEYLTKTRVDNKSTLLGQYNQERSYLKLKVSLKSAYNNYQVTLKPESSEKFILFLKTFLNSFATVLDSITVGEVDRFCKELLKHLRNFMTFLPVSSVHCVVQLFKCVFGNNQISDQLSYNDTELQNYSSDPGGCGFYTFCFQRQYQELATFLEMKHHKETEMRKEWELPRSPSHSAVVKQRRNFNMNSFPSYIKLFEPNVIQSLKQYTVASDTALQAEVLRLLSELIQLKVNYCLLDSEQVFINFLLSQFQLIEDEQLQVVDKLLPAMFDFLIQLANEKHSKPIMCVPKVIQLCDSLTASIQSVFHCILAIEPVVKHVFTKFTAIANSEEIKELETQQDVLFSILLRLIHNPKSLPLLTIVLNNSVDDQKLQRSAQVTQILFNTLVDGSLPADVESRSSIIELLFALHPASFDDQILLSSMFDTYCMNKTRDFDSWFPFISLFLLILLSKYDENSIMIGLEKQLDHPIFTKENAKDVQVEDPLCVNAAKSVNVSPETAFVQFLYRMLNVAFQHLERTKLRENSDEKIVFLREFLLIFSFIVKSGKFELVHEKLVQNYTYDIEHDRIFDITRSSYILLTIHPVIALQWYELLLYLRDRTGELRLRWYFGQSYIRFGSGRLSSSVCNLEHQCISNDAVKIGVFLLACECQDEFIDDVDVLKGFLENNFSILLNCLSDDPVQKLMSRIRDSKTASSLLIDIIRKMLNESLIEDNNLDDVLSLLDFVQESTYGEALLLCCRSCFLHSSSLPVRDQAFMVSLRMISHLSNFEEKAKLEEQVTKDQLQTVIDELLLLKSRHSRILLNSIQNVATELFDIEVPDIDADPLGNLDSLRSTSVDKEWFFKEVKKKCCDEDEQNYLKLSILLSELRLQDLFIIMEDKNFRSQILPYAFDIAVRQSLENWQTEKGVSSPELSPLFIASRSTLYRFIEHVKSSLPQVHEVYWPVKRVQQRREIQYSQRIDTLFCNKSFLECVQDIIPAVKEFVIAVQKLKLVALPESFQGVVQFAVLCSQFAHWQIKNCRKWSKIRVINSIQCCSSVLKLKPALDLVSPAQIGSIISAVLSVTESYFNDVIKLPTNPVIEKAADTDTYIVQHSSHVMSTLIDYFITKVPAVPTDESRSLELSLRELLLVLSRSDLIYNYVRIPLEIWKHVPESHVITGDCLTLNTIPEHFLQDSDILRNFVSRLMFIGWNSRLQFEECWMLLLIAFNFIPEEESSEEEVEVLSQVNVVAVSAVSSILVQTMYHPQPGSKISPNIVHVSRYNNFHLNQNQKKQRLAAVNHLLSLEFEENGDNFDLLIDKVNVNLERSNNKNKYSFNQLSVEYLSLCCQKSLNEKLDSAEERLHQLYQGRIQMFQKMGIDVNSCVYFLMDFYSRWLLKPHTHSVHVLLEVVNSMFIISDLFTEVSQFTWLLESCIIMWQKYQKDNDTVASYLIVMMCKAAAVFIPTDTETKKLVMKALRTGLGSKLGLMQSAALHGLLYLLEKIFKKNTLNAWDNLSCEFESEILSTSITFVLQNVNVDLLEISEKETAECLISVSFYLIENNACGDNASLLIDRLLKLSVRACKLKLWDVQCTIMQGFYNLLLFDNERMGVYNNELGQLVKEILSTVSCPPFVCVQCLQMLATCMYLSDDFEDRTNEEANESFDTEKLVARMEKITFFFKRIKTGTKSEARFICTLLPQILIDLFPSSEILNKVILEFLSPSQRYPEFMAQIVFKVFQHTIQQSELPLIQDWVLSLLNNSRNYPTEKAVFYLTCLFISACANPWLVAFFSLISLRHTELKYQDKKLLYLSAAQFYTQLNSESQRKAFISTFRIAEESSPTDPLSGILKIIL